MKTKIIEFSTIAHDLLKEAIKKTNDKDSMLLFDEVAHMENFGYTTYWRMEKDFLFGFIDELYLVKNPDVATVNKILQNCHEKGYYRKTFRY